MVGIGSKSSFKQSITQPQPTCNVGTTDTQSTAISLRKNCCTPQSICNLLTLPIARQLRPNVPASKLKPPHYPAANQPSTNTPIPQAQLKPNLPHKNRQQRHNWAKITSGNPVGSQKKRPFPHFPASRQDYFLFRVQFFHPYVTMERRKPFQTL